MSEGSSKAAVKNLGWRVTLAGLGINLALGILYIWSVISRGVPDEWGWSQLDTWPGFDLFARIRPRLTAGAFQPVRARRLFSSLLLYIPAAVLAVRRHVDHGAFLSCHFPPLCGWRNAPATGGRDASVVLEPPEQVVNRRPSSASSLVSVV